MSQLNPRINLTYVLVTMVAVFLTWLFHEFAHWCVGEILGNEMVMTLNTCYPKSGRYLADWHSMAISAAGPLVTILQALIFYFLLKKSNSSVLFSFLLTALYMRALAGIMNFINLNDEGRISDALGLSSFTLPFIVFGILFYLVYSIVTNKGLAAKFVTATILLIMLLSSILILSDQAFKIVVL